MFEQLPVVPMVSKPQQAPCRFGSGPVKRAAARETVPRYLMESPRGTAGPSPPDAVPVAASIRKDL